MDLSLMFAIILTGAAVIGANIALISWLRSDLADTIGVTKTGFILQAIHEKIRTFKAASS